MALETEDSARRASELYQAIQDFQAIKPHTVVIEGRRVWAPAVIELCRRAGFTPRTLRRWADKFRSALEAAEKAPELSRPEAIYSAFQALSPRKGGKVLRADDRRLKLRPEEQMMVRDLWLKRSQPSVAKIFDRLKERCIRCGQGEMRPIRRDFQGRYQTHRCENSECGFELSYPSVQKAIKLTWPSAAALARRGRKYYDDHFGGFARRDWSCVGRNEMIFGGRHQLDVWVWNPAQRFLEDGKTPWLFSPWIFAWQDAATSVVAWRLGLRPNSDLLIDALGAYVKRFGVPTEAWGGNHEDYRSERLQKLCANLGVKLRRTLPSKLETGECHARSNLIHRWFGTLERGLIQELPGWIGANAKQREERRDLEVRWKRQHAEFLRGERKTTPLRTFDEIRQIIEAWVEQHFHKLPTRRQNCAPLEAFAADSRPIHTVSDRDPDLPL